MIRLSLEEHLSNKSMSTVKGELIPRMVANQFKNNKNPDDLTKQRYSLENKEIRLVNYKEIDMEYWNNMMIW